MTTEITNTSSQLALPVQIRPEEIARKKTLGDSLQMCAELAGYSLDKELQLKLGVDKAQFSRWNSGEEGIKWPKLMKVMDLCGNDAPLWFMNYQRGYDLNSLHKRKSLIEMENQRLRDENSALRRVLQGQGV